MKTRAPAHAGDATAPRRAVLAPRCEAAAQQHAAVIHCPSTPSRTSRKRLALIVVCAMLGPFAFSGCGTTIGFTYENPDYGSSTITVKLPDRRGLAKGG